jgi:hypothetical protein
MSEAYRGGSQLVIRRQGTGDPVALAGCQIGVTRDLSGRTVRRVDAAA